MRMSHFLLCSYSYGAHVGLAKGFTYTPESHHRLYQLYACSARITQKLEFVLTFLCLLIIKKFILTKKIYLFSIFKESTSLSRHACGIMGGSLHRHYNFHPLFFSSASALSSQ